MPFPDPQITNAVINTTRASVATLTGINAMLGHARPKHLDAQGGMVDYVMLIAFNSDIQPSDIVLVQSWEGTPLTPPMRCRVNEAGPEGGLGLQITRCLLTRWTGR